MKKIFKKMGLFLFLKEFFQHPASIGSVFPSSVLLAKTIAEQIPKNLPGYIVEIGPGTGVITEMILKSGIDPQRFIAIERSESFYMHLKQRFPKMNIIHGDATRLSELLGDKANDVEVIVSSLPLRSLPPDIAKKMGQTFAQTLKSKGLFIQFTYSWIKSHFSLPANFQYIYSKYIFCNLPPARIDVFEAVEPTKTN